MADAPEATRALVLRALRDGRIRTIGFAYVFAVYALLQAYAYRHAYPTAASRRAFAASFAGNRALRLFYGVPHSLLSVGGYCAWRVGGTLAILAAAYGLLAAVRALRTEEEAGRAELVLAGGVGRGRAYASALAAIGAGTLALWVAELVGLVAGGLPLRGSAYLALATVSVVPPCAAIGALVSQLASTRRAALELGGAIVAALFALRVVADTASGAGWLRWATPLGWAEEMRPFAGPVPAALLPALAAAALLLLGAARLLRRRDIGTGMLSVRDQAPPRLALLSSPLAQALRAERGTLSVWVAGTAAFAFVLGLVSAGISPADVPASLREQIAKLGIGSIATPSGYLSFVFIFLVLALSVFVCGQLGAARHEEDSQRLETLLALPVGRAAWLTGRLALAALAAGAIGLTAGFATWLGTAPQSVHVSLGQMLAAGANGLPVALLFLGVAALAYAALPRAGVGLAYALVATAFLWELVGSLLGVPHWLVDVTPFAHVGLIPAQGFRAGAAAAMLAIGAAAAAAAIALLRRRDLLGA